MLLEELEREFEAARRSGGLRDAFDGWRVDEPALSHYSDLDALIDHFRDRDSSYASKTATSLVLCRLVQQGDRMATLLLFEIYMPALRTIVQRNLARCDLPMAELESAAAEGFLIRAQRVEPGHEKIHGFLAWGARDEVLRRVRAGSKRATGEATAELTESAVTEPAAEDQWLAASAPEEVLSDAVRAGILGSFDAELIADTRLEDTTLAQYAERVGMTRGAIKIRRRRAENKLAAWLWARARLTDEDSSSDL